MYDSIFHICVATNPCQSNQIVSLHALVIFPSSLSVHMFYNYAHNHLELAGQTRSGIGYRYGEGDSDSEWPDQGYRTPARPDW